MALRSIWGALLAAALFGMSAPAAKALVGVVSPLLLAGLLYLGSGVGLGLWGTLQRWGGETAHSPREAPLQPADYPWLAGAVASGGVVAPVLLVYGLTATSASSASLVLSLEGVLTGLLAAVLFREAVGRRVWLAALLMFVAVAALSWSASTVGRSAWWGVLLILGACLMWALDNNLTRHLAARDPIAIARIKGLTAGAVNAGIGLALAQPLPGMAPAAGALAVGALGYGASLVLFVYALRHLGAARTGALFGAAPFVGAVCAVVFLGEPITTVLLAAGALMAAATWLLLREAHAHEHAHADLAHAHRHLHDDHHGHAHPEGQAGDDHAHEHEHDLLVHSHAHVPDLHHRHEHASRPDANRQEEGGRAQ